MVDELMDESSARKDARAKEAAEKYPSKRKRTSAAKAAIQIRRFAARLKPCP